jgi:hypothetical protein
MNCLERAITDGHAKLTCEGEHARPGRRRLRPGSGRWRAMPETGFETVSCGSRGDEAQTEIGKQKTKMGQSLLTSAATRVAQASAPVGCGSVPLPVRNRATTRGGTPLEPQCQAEVRPGTAALRSNDLQPVSQEALIGAIKKMNPCLHRPSPAGGGTLVAASGKEAPCRSSAAVPGCECGWRLAASSIAGRDACATRFTQDHAAPTALGRIELKMPIKFSTRFGNGRILPAKTVGDDVRSL